MNIYFKTILTIACLIVLGGFALAVVYSQNISYQKPDLSLFTSPFFSGAEDLSLKTANQYPVTPFQASNPPPPRNIVISDPGHGDILDLSWKLPVGVLVEKVRIYRSAAAGQLGRLVAEVPASQLFWQDQGLTTGQTYFYVLHSVAKNGEESDSVNAFRGIPQDLTPPSAPKDVKIEPLAGGSEILITWENTKETDFAHVQIYRSQIRGELGMLVGANIKEETFKDHGLFNGQTYYYTLTSIDKNGNESSTYLIDYRLGKNNIFEPWP